MIFDSYALSENTAYECNAPDTAKEVAIVLGVGSGSSMPTSNRTVLIIPRDILNKVHTVTIFKNTTSYASISADFITQNGYVYFRDITLGSNWAGSKHACEIYYR